LLQNPRAGWQASALTLINWIDVLATVDKFPRKEHAHSSAREVGGVCVALQQVQPTGTQVRSCVYCPCMELLSHTLDIIYNKGCMGGLRS
jgi:hypothetical protein